MVACLTAYITPHYFISFEKGDLYFTFKQKTQHLHKSGVEEKCYIHRKTMGVLLISSILKLSINSTISPISPVGSCLHQKYRRLRQFILIFWIGLLLFTKCLKFLSFHTLHHIQAGILPLHFLYQNSSCYLMCFSYDNLVGYCVAPLLNVMLCFSIIFFMSSLPLNFSFGCPVVRCPSQGSSGNSLSTSSR